MTKKLRVWWIPQVPMKPFHFTVFTLCEAKMLIIALGEYDLFQYKNKIKPDYSNAGGLEEYVDGEWLEYEDEEGRTIDEIEYEELSIEKNSKWTLFSFITIPAD